MLPNVLIPVLSTNDTLHTENIFCFVHHLIWNITILKIWLTFHYFMKLCKHFGISLHKLLKGVFYLWFPRVTLHLNIYGSLPGVVFVTIAIIYSVLPLNVYTQMVQNVCINPLRSVPMLDQWDFSGENIFIF